MRLISLQILFIITLHVESFSQWEWSNPKPRGSTLNSVIYIGDDEYIAAGYGGVIVKSYDNGESWEVIKAGLNKAINSLYITGNNIWAVGDSGTILKSSDRGTSWEKLQPIIGSNLFSIKFISDSIGFAVGSESLLLKTTDSGETWTDTLLASSPNILKYIFFRDTLNGWITTTNGIMYKTIDGGKYWESQQTDITGSIFFSDDSIGFGTSTYNLLRTNNGGKTWTVAVYNAYARSIQFYDKAHGWAAGSSRIYITADSGKTWKYIYNESLSGSTSFCFKDTLNGAAVGASGTMVQTSDGGNNWIKRQKGFLDQVKSISFFDNNHGIAGTYYGLYKTSDGGINWIKDTLVSGQIAAAQVLNATDGLVLGYYNKLFKTTDQGRNWEAITIPFDNYRAMTFTDSLNGYILSNGKVRKTTDGGYTWNDSYVSYGQTIRFYDKLNGIIAGEYYYYKTSDGGLTWNSRNLFSSKRIFDIYIKDSLSYWACGEAGSLYKSEDGGSTWIKIQTGLTTDLYAITFSSSTTGYVCGFNGELLRTMDEGQTWKKITSGTVNALHTIFFTSKNIGYTAGTNGTILVTHNLGGPPDPDVKPPFIKFVSPVHSSYLIPVNEEIIIRFSEPVSHESINDNNVLLSANGFPLKKSLEFNDSLFVLKVVPDSLLPENSVISIILSASIQDTAGLGLDGNFNGISEGSPADDYSFNFRTIAKLDSIPPRISYNLIPGDSLWKETSPIIQLVISDSSYSIISTVSFAEYFIDTVSAFYEGIRILPSDGNYDAYWDTLKIRINLSSLGLGPHKILVHAKDSSGNWSGFTTIQFYIINQEYKDNWSMFGANAQHTSSVTCDSLTLPLKLLWQKEISESELSYTTVYNGSVFTILRSFNQSTYWYDHTLYKLDINDGSEQMHDLISNKYYVSTPSFLGGYMLRQYNYHDDDTYIAAHDLTGNLIWKTSYKPQWDMNLPPTVCDGVIITSWNYNTQFGIHAYDLFTGNHLWYKSFPIAYSGWTPAIYDSVVYAFNESTLSAINLYSGEVIWSRTDIPYQTTFEYRGSYVPVVDTLNNIVLATSALNLSAVHIHTGSVLWSKEGKFISSPAVFEDKVYTINNSRLTVYDIFTGEEIWSFKGNNYISNQPVVANGIVFFSSNTHLYAADARTFEIKWEYLVGGAITVANNKVIIASSHGIMYVFDSDIPALFSQDPSLPKVYDLEQNFPNPFNSQTVIRFALPEACNVSLKIFNLLGEKVSELINEYREPGYHQITFNADNFASGVYIYQIETQKFTKSKKLLLIK